MVPTPTPAPPMPIQAMPAPIIFAAWGSMRELLFEVCPGEVLVTRVDRIIEIDAGEDREDVGLQECHQKLQCRECDGEPERQNRAEPTEQAERTQHGDEAAEHLQSDVTGEHVGEQTNAVRNRSRQERQHFDESDQGQDVDWNPARHEQLEEVQPVLPEAIDY